MQTRTPHTHTQPLLTLASSEKSTETAFSSLKQNPLVLYSFWQTKLRFSARDMLREMDFSCSIKCLNLSGGENIPCLTQ